MSQLRVGLLGAGNMGRTHAQNWAAIPDAEIVGVLATTRDAAGKLAPQSTGAIAYSDFDTLLREAKPDIIDICTPTPTHCEFVQRAAAAGKAIFVEKPLGRTLAECDAAVAAVEKAGVPVMAGHVLRYFPEFAAAKRMADSGALGNAPVVRTARLAGLPGTGRDLNWYADPDQSGGVVLDLIIHDFDWLRWCFGPVTRVMAKGLAADPAHRGRRDYALVTLRFQSGALAHVTGSWAHPAGFQTTFEIAGDGGMVEHDSRLTVPLVIARGSSSTDFAARAGNVPVPESPLADGHNPYYLELKAFVEAVRTGGTPPVTIYDAREAVRIGLAALESIQTGKVVTLS